MPKLKVVAVSDNNYTLQDVSSSEMHTLNLRFLGVEKTPKVGDFIGMHNELLDKNYVEYSNNYIFGPLNKPYGREIENVNHTDCILVSFEKDKVYLKRFFG